MKFNVFMFLLFFIVFAGLYAMATQQTAGSICRDAGRAIGRSAGSSDVGGASNAIERSLAKFGRAIEATCTRR